MNASDHSRVAATRLSRAYAVRSIDANQHRKDDHRDGAPYPALSVHSGPEGRALANGFCPWCLWGGIKLLLAYGFRSSLPIFPVSAPNTDRSFEGGQPVLRRRNVADRRSGALALEETIHEP